jgi:hypothetical protein
MIGFERAKASKDSGYWYTVMRARPGNYEYFYDAGQGTWIMMLRVLHTCIEHLMFEGTRNVPFFEVRS